MHSLRHAKALLIEDNPHLFGGTRSLIELPEWISCLQEKETAFVPHFYAPDSAIKSFFIEKGSLILDLSKAALRIHLDDLFDELKKAVRIPDEIVCINTEWNDFPACTKRIYRYQSDKVPCIPPLPPFQEFIYQSIPFSEDELFRHIATLYDLREAEAFHRLFLFFLDNNGQPFNYRKTAEILDIRFETLKTFLAYLEKAFVVRILEEGSGPKARRLSLITDWRLVNHLLKKSRMELFLEGVDRAASMSFKFLEIVSQGRLPSLSEIEGE